MTSSRPSRSRAWFLVLFGGLVLVQVWRLLLTPHGLTSTWTRGDDIAVASTGGRGLAQEFVMGADGLDGLWLRPVRPAGQIHPLSGRVVVGLAEITRRGNVPLLRQVLDARTLDTHGPVRLRVPEIRASRGRRYLFTVTHVGYHDAGALHLRSRRADALPGASFTADGQERWGDLMFETSSGRATLPYWMHEVLGPWPAFLRTGWVVGGVLLLFNVLLGAACLGVADRGSRIVGPVVLHDAAAGALRRATWLAGAAIVVGGLIVVLWPTSAQRVIRLVDHMPDARIETTAGKLHDGVEVQPVGIAGRAYEAIVALPTSRIAWTVDVPKGALLLGHAAMRPDVWTKAGDGANLTVSIESDDTKTIVAQFTLVPYFVAEHQQPHPMRVSLDPWAGKTVTVAFETDPERWGNAVNDVPIWVNPRIEWPRGHAWGVAKIRDQDGGGRKEEREGRTEELRTEDR